MTNTITITDTIQAIIDASATTKMMDSKKAFKAITKAITGYKHTNIKPLIKVINDATTKADMLINLEKLNTLIKLVIDNPKAEQEASKALLKDLSVLIKIEVDKGQEAFLKVGQYLSEGLQNIKDNDGKQKDFLAWANLTCGIKKAQCYKLMAVYKSFGKDSEFNGVSMRVLYTLTSQDDKVLEACKPLALAGKLDTKALNKMIDKHMPAKTVAPKTAPKSANGGTVAPSGTVSEDSKDTAITRTKESKELEALKEQVKAGESDTIKALNKTISELTQELKEARASKASTANTMPNLPQFSSVLPYIVLGIDPEMVDDKAVINKAYRAMACIFTKNSNSFASDKLLTARDTLLSAIA